MKLLEICSNKVNTKAFVLSFSIVQSFCVSNFHIKLLKYIILNNNTEKRCKTFFFLQKVYICSLGSKLNKNISQLI